MDSLRFFSALGICLILTCFSQSSLAVGNPEAPVGGTFNRNIGGEPTSIHPLTSSDLYSQTVHEYVFDKLLERSPETGAFVPRLAEKWESSKDNKVVTFFLRKNAVFHDGKPVTAEDVKFSFDALFDPAYKALSLRPYYEGIAKVEIVDPSTVKFYMKDTYFQNFISASLMYIIPKHIYQDVEKSTKMTKVAVGSGPYSLDKFEAGQKVVLKRFDKWYGFQTSEWKGSHNFATVVLRFIRDPLVSLEMLRKGTLDYDELTPENFIKNTADSPWGQKVFAVKAANRTPRRYYFVGWNFRNDLFQNKNVRLALSHLMNREEMNQKFRYGLSDLATGPTYLKSEFASETVKPLLFEPKKAQELLAKSGWKDSDKDGVLDKKVAGKKVDFRFSLVYANKDWEKYWAMYKEDLKKVGIEMDLKYLEWGSFLKTLDSGKFEAVALGWSTTQDWDPKQTWHSASSVPGGSNFIGYKNQTVDRLIDQARLEPDKKARIAKLKKVYELVAADAPYVFMFNDKFEFYAHSNRVEKNADTLQFAVGHEFWWSKP